MDIKVEVRIKLGEDKEIRLSHDDAKKLYEELGILFQKEKEYVPSYPVNPYIDTYPKIWRDPIIYTDKTVPLSPTVITCNAESTPNEISLSAMDEAGAMIKEFEDFDEQKCLEFLRVKPENDLFEKVMTGEYNGSN